MSQSVPLNEVAAATRRFLRSLEPQAERVQASVASAAGMPVLCAVEAALAELLPARAAQELVWLTAGSAPGVHRLRLCAYGADGRVVAESAHEFAA